MHQRASRDIFILQNNYVLPKFREVLMHEQITALGWAWHGYTCKCEGGGKLYIKGGYKLKHYPNGTFWFGIKNRAIARGNESTLIETINKFN